MDCGPPKMVDGAVVTFGNRDNGTLFGATVRYVCVEEDGVQLSNSKAGGDVIVVCVGGCFISSVTLFIA